MEIIAIMVGLSCLIASGFSGYAIELKGGQCFAILLLYFRAVLQYDKQESGTPTCGSASVLQYTNLGERT